MNELEIEYRKLAEADRITFDDRLALYLLRVGRAASYALASYILLWLQPHYRFSFAAFALVVFLLSSAKRSLFVAEIALILLIISIFVPAGFPSAVLGLK